MDVAEQRLIDANAVITIQVFDEMTEEYSMETLTVAHAIDRWSDEGCPPTIDAVEVVRCRECKYNTGRHNSTPWLEGDIVCEWWGADGVPDDGFCHMGAKTDGGADHA